MELTRNAVGGVVDESLGEEVDTVLVEALDSLREVDGVPLRERRLVVRELADARPRVLVGGAKETES